VNTEDRLAITDLIYRYAELIDAGDFEGIACLTRRAQEHAACLE